MHFASTLVAAGTLGHFGAASAAAVAIPAEIRPRAFDVTVKFFAHTTCSHSGGPEHGLTKNDCIPLPADSHGMKITDHNGGCYINRYSDSN